MLIMDKARKLVRKFGKRLRQLRQERGWTQQDLAILLEVEQSYISGVERGIYSPSLSKLGLLAECLGLTVAEMFEGM
jgi:transcriptional regulator with XRE-family HTH domain